MLGLAAGSGAWFVHRPEFGRSPSGERLARIKASPHYQNGQFQCLEPVGNIMEGDENRFAAMWKFLFGDKSELSPQQTMLSRKIDLKALDVSENIIVWMGHSTFYLQLGGRRILIDPVFTSYASPLFFINKAFPGSNVYTAADMPDIDVLVVSHDHWDHLDYPTIMSLQSKIREIVCPLGVGEYFEQWGFALNQLHEEDWFTEVKLADDFSVHVLPSQHFSGRFLQPNSTQWASFAFVIPKHRVFYSGDGGYGAHFKEIGRSFGGFDLAIMENGQYDAHWHRIHLLPQETAQATEELGAKLVIPAHSGKFALARHAWNAPYRAFVHESQNKRYEIITPEIGELAHIGAAGQNFDYWWEKMS